MCVSVRERIDAGDHLSHIENSSVPMYMSERIQVSNHPECDAEILHTVPNADNRRRRWIPLARITMN